MRMAVDAGTRRAGVEGALMQAAVRGRTAVAEGSPTSSNVMNGLVLFTVYAHPRDFPEHFVVRPFFVVDEGGEYAYLFGCVYESLEEARDNLRRLGANPIQEGGGGSPIVEVWSWHGRAADWPARL
jgi:hypothetical protein